jgi:hypothetical protein
MGWFEDAVNVATNPVGYAAGQLFGGSAGQAAGAALDPLAGARKKFAEGYKNPSNLLIPGSGMFANELGIGTPKEQQAGGGFDIPDYTGQWEALAQGLNADKLAAEIDPMRQQIGSNLADTRSQLAMKGGLSSGADERLATQSMDAFGDAYSNLATKYGLGSAEISKQAIEKKQEMDLAKAMGADKANAIRNAGGGGLFGGNLIPGFL